MSMRMVTYLGSCASQSTPVRRLSYQCAMCYLYLLHVLTQRRMYDMMYGAAHYGGT